MLYVIIILYCRTKRHPEMICNSLSCQGHQNLDHKTRNKRIEVTGATFPDFQQVEKVLFMQFVSARDDMMCEQTFNLLFSALLLLLPAAAAAAAEIIHQVKGGGDACSAQGSRSSARPITSLHERAGSGEGVKGGGARARHPLDVDWLITCGSRNTRSTSGNKKRSREERHVARSRS